MSRGPLTVVSAESAESAAVLACDVVAEALREAVTHRGTASLALSGGRTPGRMVELLAPADVPWAAVHVFQVDERDVPGGDRARNWRLLSPLLERLPAANAHPMPVEQGDADRTYADLLRALCGHPPLLDVVQLGMGADGHTASLPPGDPVVGVLDRDVAWSQVYARHRRLTLTLRVLGAARTKVWLVTGAEKAQAVRRLVDGDEALVAARVGGEGHVLVADREAASLLDEA